MDPWTILAAALAKQLVSILDIAAQKAAGQEITPEQRATEKQRTTDLMKQAQTLLDKPQA